MLRVIAQAVLWVSGLVAALFMSRDEPNFPLWQMTVGLLLLVGISVAIWWFTSRKDPKQ